MTLITESGLPIQGNHASNVATTAALPSGEVEGTVRYVFAQDANYILVVPPIADSPPDAISAGITDVEGVAATWVKQESSAASGGPVEAQKDGSSVVAAVTAIDFKGSSVGVLANGTVVEVTPYGDITLQEKTWSNTTTNVISSGDPIADAMEPFDTLTVFSDPEKIGVAQGAGSDSVEIDLIVDAPVIMTRSDVNFNSTKAPIGYSTRFQLKYPTVMTNAATFTFIPLWASTGGNALQMAAIQATAVVGTEPVLRMDTPTAFIVDAATGAPLQSSTPYRTASLNLTDLDDFLQVEFDIFTLPEASTGVPYTDSVTPIAGLLSGNGGNTDGTSNGASAGAITTALGTGITPGSVTISVGTTTWTEDGAGNLVAGVTGTGGTPASGGTIDYATGILALTWAAAEPAAPTAIDVLYRFSFLEAVFFRLSVNGFLVGQGVMDKSLLSGDLKPGIQLSTTDSVARKIILRDYSVREITSIADTMYAVQRTPETLPNAVVIEPSTGIDGQLLMDGDETLWKYDGTAPDYWTAAAAASAPALVDATVGVGGDYADVQAAITAGFYRLRMIADVTEPSALTLDANGLFLYIDDGVTFDMGANQIVCPVACRVSFDGNGTVAYGFSSSTLFFNVTDTSNTDTHMENIRVVNTSTANNCTWSHSFVGQYWRNVHFTLPNEYDGGIDMSKGQINGLTLAGTGTTCSNCLLLTTVAANAITFTGQFERNINEPVLKVEAFASVSDVYYEGSTDCYIRVAGKLSGLTTRNTGDVTLYAFAGGRLSHCDTGDQGKLRMGSSNIRLTDVQWKLMDNTFSPNDMHFSNCRSGVLAIAAGSPGNIFLDNHHADGDLTLATDHAYLTNCEVEGDILITGDWNSVIGGKVGLGASGTDTIKISGAAKGNIVNAVQVQAPITDTSTEENAIGLVVEYS